jgi:hypothetical protein
MPRQNRSIMPQNVNTWTPKHLTEWTDIDYKFYEPQLWSILCFNIKLNFVYSYALLIGGAFNVLGIDN